jgi:hypothetical protein
MEGIFSLSFCVTATRTVITPAAGPPIRILTTYPSIWRSSRLPPPVPERYGLISSSTCMHQQTVLRMTVRRAASRARRGELLTTLSTLSAVRSRPVSVSTICSTSRMSGILSRRRVSMPILSVMVELGQEPHAPCSLSTTTRPSISCSATLPPSAIRLGRTSSSTFSTFSSVSGSTRTAHPAPRLHAHTLTAVIVQTCHLLHAVSDYDLANLLGARGGRAPSAATWCG